MNPSDPISQYMVKKPITFRPEQSIHDVINLLVRKKISGAPVVNEAGELVGMISEKDCLRVIVDSVYHNLPAGKVRDYMSSSVTSISHRRSVVEVANDFMKANFKRFPILNEAGQLVGQISRSDVLRLIKDMKGATWQLVAERAANDHTVVKENHKDRAVAPQA